MERIHIPTLQCGMRQSRYITCIILRSKKQHGLYLHFRSTATWTSFHCERKSILHTWKQLVMVLFELNLDQIIHGWVIQGKHYPCSTLPESHLLFIFSLGWFTLTRTAGPGHAFAGHESISYWDFSFCLIFFPPPSPGVVFVVMGVLVFKFFFCFLFRAPARGPKENVSAFQSRWLPVDMPSADAHVEYVLSSKHLGCCIKKCSAFQNPGDGEWYALDMPLAVTTISWIPLSPNASCWSEG